MIQLERNKVANLLISMLTWSERNVRSARSSTSFAKIPGQTAAATPKCKQAQMFAISKHQPSARKVR